MTIRRIELGRISSVCCMFSNDLQQVGHMLRRLQPWKKNWGLQQLMLRKSAVIVWGRQLLSCSVASTASIPSHLPFGSWVAIATTSSWSDSWSKIWSRKYVAYTSMYCELHGLYRMYWKGIRSEQGISQVLSLFSCLIVFIYLFYDVL